MILCRREGLPELLRPGAELLGHLHGLPGVYKVAYPLPLGTRISSMRGRKSKNVGKKIKSAGKEHQVEEDRGRKRLWNWKAK